MMTNEQIVNELKDKRLPTFGTFAERKDRLKKHHGKSILPTNTSYHPNKQTNEIRIVCNMSNTIIGIQTTT